MDVARFCFHLRIRLDHHGLTFKVMGIVKEKHASILNCTFKVFIMATYIK